MTSKRDQEYKDSILSEGNWITDKFLEDVLREDKNKDLKVTEKNISVATSVGDNYLSAMYRVLVKYLENGSGVKEKSLIIKSRPYVENTLLMVEELRVFEVEGAMYNKILPKMRSVMREYSDEEFFAPESYTCERKDTLIMEDLKDSGYQMVDRRNLLDFGHCKAALKSHARFHALSLVVMKDPEIKKLMEGMKGWMTESSRNSIDAYYNQIVTKVIEVLEPRPQLKRFTNLLKKYSKDSFGNLIYSGNLKAKYFDVFCHGDTWLTNMMFNYDANGDVRHAKLLDYQVGRLASPVFDVLHVLFSSCHPDVLSERMYELASIYHESLSSDFELFKVDQEIFTLDQFLLEMREKAGFPIFSSVYMLPHILIDSKDIPDFGTLDEVTRELDNDHNIIGILYRNPKKVEIFEKVLIHYEKIGYIESVLWP